ncbi:hypothetical protein CYMTET_14155, partial [Cymbomonas tetramitiformis]
LVRDLEAVEREGGAAPESDDARAWRTGLASWQDELERGNALSPEEVEEHVDGNPSSVRDSAVATPVPSYVSTKRCARSAMLHKFAP